MHFGLITFIFMQQRIVLRKEKRKQHQISNQENDSEYWAQIHEITRGYHQVYEIRQYIRDYIRHNTTNQISYSMNRGI